MMSLKFLEYFSWSATNMWQFDLHFRWFWAIWWAGKCHLCLKTHAHITFSCRWICVKDDNFQARTMHSNKCMAITGDSFNFDGSEFSTTSWDETHSTCMISWQIFTQLVITNVTDGSGNLAQLVAFDASQIGTAYNGIWQRYSSQLWSFLFYAYIYIYTLFHLSFPCAFFLKTLMVRWDTQCFPEHRGIIKFGKKRICSWICGYAYTIFSDFGWLVPH